MSVKKVLFITQEITPYVPESEQAIIGRDLPQAIQDKGREIRTFMPKWGNINERRWHPSKQPADKFTSSTTTTISSTAK